MLVDRALAAFTIPEMQSALPCSDGILTARVLTCATLEIYEKLKPLERFDPRMVATLPWFFALILRAASQEQDFEKATAACDRSTMI